MTRRPWPGRKSTRSETQKKVADAQYEQAKAGLEEARIWQGFTRVTHSAAGVVTDKRVDPGSMASRNALFYRREATG